MKQDEGEEGRVSGGPQVGLEPAARESGSELTTFTSCHYFIFSSLYVYSNFWLFFFSVDGVEICPEHHYSCERVNSHSCPKYFFSSECVEFVPPSWNSSCLCFCVFVLRPWGSLTTSVSSKLIKDPMFCEADPSYNPKMSCEWDPKPTLLTNLTSNMFFKKFHTFGCNVTSSGLISQIMFLFLWYSLSLFFFWFWYFASSSWLSLGLLWQNSHSLTSASNKHVSLQICITAITYFTRSQDQIPAHNMWVRPSTLCSSELKTTQNPKMIHLLH